MDTPIGHLSNTSPREEGTKVGAWLNRRRGAVEEVAAAPEVEELEEAPAPVRRRTADPLAELRSAYAEDAGEADPAPAPAARPARPTLADARAALAERAMAATPAPRRSQAAPQPVPPRRSPAPSSQGPSSGASLARGVLGALLGKKP